MKKNILLVFTLICTIIAISSCSKTETYADMLKKERRAIDFIRDSLDISVLNKMPERGYEFADNEFYKDENTGVYIRVINWGEGEEIEERTTVYLRYWGSNLLLRTKENITGNIAPKAWIKTIYYTDLDPNKYIIANPTTIGEQYAMYLLSVGSMLPLKFDVRHGGSVSLIVPFSSGSSLQLSQYEPMYIEELRYEFE